jgi:hypothetical protein
MDGEASFDEIRCLLTAGISKNVQQLESPNTYRPVLGSTQTHFKGNLGFLLVLTRPKREADYSPPSITEVKNEMS